MENTKEYKSTTNKKKLFILNMVTTMIGLICAFAIENFGFPLLGWFLGGIIIGLGALFSYKKPINRWNIFNIVIIIITGIVMTTIYNLF